MTEPELIEQLADKEHASWARWMDYLFSKCLNPTQEPADGRLIIPGDLVRYWMLEVRTPYAELSERLKQFDRDEVTHILPIIKQYADQGERGADGT